MRYQPKQTRQAFGRRYCLITNLGVRVRTDETSQVAWPHIRLDDLVASDKRVDPKILLKAICDFDGLVVTAHKVEVGLEQKQKLELEFGLSAVT